MKVLIIGKRNFSPVRRALNEMNWLPLSGIEDRGSVRRALTTLAEEEFDFIFCELCPSRQPLFDRLAQLRQAAPEATILAITPQGSQSWDEEVLRTGADDVIERPDLNAATVSRVIRYALERRKMTQEYLKASATARELARVKSNFMANMSHEIRTPMNLIMGTADLLAETNLTPQQQRLVKSLSSSGNHLLSLLSDVLDLSQVESQGLLCTDASFDLHEVFLEACEIISVLCRAKKLTFDYLTDPALPRRFVGDRVRLRQVMLNVLNNAVKFTKRGGVVLRIDSVERSNSDCRICIVVKDTGIGIASAELNRVFDCFYQSESGLERHYHGSGLGLSIVKAIVDHYDGDVQIESTPGHGTEVKITLRLALDVGAEKVEVPYLRGQKILIATQGAFEAQNISHQLQRLGATTVWMSSGEAAAHRLEKDADFDLAILDIQTADLGALQIIERPEFTFPRDKVVLLLPPLHRRDDISRCEQLGINKYIYKPFAADQFQAVIGETLPGARPFPTPFHSLKLLVVDDDFDTRELMAAFLAKTHHRVFYARDGSEALSLAQRREFDLILMDIEMPGLNGYETTRRLRTLKNCERTKIVGLSANAFPENIAEAKRVGFSGYLTKPIRKERLLASIVECTNAQGFYEAVPSNLGNAA